MCNFALREQAQQIVHLHVLSISNDITYNSLWIVLVLFKLQFKVLF